MNNLSAYRIWYCSKWSFSWHFSAYYRTERKIIVVVVEAFFTKKKQNSMQMGHSVILIIEFFESTDNFNGFSS